MATIHTLIDYDRQNPTAISREQYTDVGSDAFAPGTFPRAFNDLEVWDAASGGNQLVLDTDYEYTEVDYELSAANFENEAVYKKLRVYEYSGAGADGTFIGPTLADNLGRVLEIHNADPTYKLTFDLEDAETIDGNLTVVLPSQYNYLKVRAGTAG